MKERQQNEVFAEWTKLHRSIFYKVAHSFSSHVAEQEDLIQEITVAVWKTARYII